MAITFGEKIKEARKQKGLTQKQLANLIGAAHNSISDWENNKNKPDPDTIELLCGALKITPNYLLASAEDEFSPKEKFFIKKYRFLDIHGQELVNLVLEKEYERLIQESSLPTAVPVRLISYYYKNASAGTGQVIFDYPPDTNIEIPDIQKYKNVSYAIGVNGSSMEPLYHDGDILLIEATREMQIGDIGIFQVNEECFVKKLGESELISLNPDFPNIPLNESAIAMGKVIDTYKLN